MAPPLVGIQLTVAFRCDGLQVFEVDHAVVEDLRSDGSNRSGDCRDACWPAGEPGG